VLLRIKNAEDKLRHSCETLTVKVADQEKALSNQIERWQLLVEHVTGPVWDFDLRTDKAFYSSRWYSSLGYSEDELDNQIDDFLNLVHPSDKAMFSENLYKYLNRIIGSLSVEIRMKHKNKSYRWFQINCYAIWDNQGHPLRLIGLQTDITEQKERLSELTSIAMYDNLTGLANRVSFMISPIKCLMTLRGRIKW
ncbi:MAG TPA: PAS domain-containing protein, partial [Fibrobacteraceae bacterium]|nr:PAS domain-containing protein [Fibrobacteraceae bacterium]